MSIMLPRARLGLAAVLFAVGALLCASQGRGQTFNLENDRVQMAELRGLWRFQTGDDMRWADPGFDDSSWKQLRSDTDWSQQGYADYGGFAWYRFKVIVPDGAAPLGLYLPSLSTSYQVFADGRLINQFGGLPPHQRVYTKAPRLIALPPARQGQPMVIAIRVWQWLYGSQGTGGMALGGGPIGTARVGDMATLREWASLQDKLSFWKSCATQFVVMALLIGGFAGLALFALRRNEPEYLWFALYEILQAAHMELFTSEFAGLHSSWQHGLEILWSSLSFVCSLAFLLFLMRLLGVRRSRLAYVAFASQLMTWVIFECGELAWILIPGSLHWGAIASWNVAQSLAEIPYHFCILFLLGRAARRGIPDARLLVFPVGLASAVSVLKMAVYIFHTLGFDSISRHLRLFLISFQQPIPFTTGLLASLLVQVSLLAILVLRFARTRRNEERHSSELEAARVVQQVLVPEGAPAIPGFEIHSVYKPAGEVGGDFFQILPLPEGGVLVAIGDVSGKGMSAAMMVSLLVGKLQTLADSTTSPPEILKGLNRRLHARSRGGFTTCLILRADPNGDLTIANAGHISPYKNGAEIPVENGLPLGLSESATYSETRIRLGENEQLTLVTDGVVEARGKDGELFGFARTLAISNSPAEAIAQAAQDFGQDDDISVIAITRTGVLQAITA
jgi:Stage II sporulation protein E (SpoIIE)